MCKHHQQQQPDLFHVGSGCRDPSPLGFLWEWGHVLGLPGASKGIELRHRFPSLHIPTDIVVYPAAISSSSNSTTRRMSGAWRMDERAPWQPVNIINFRSFDVIPESGGLHFLPTVTAASPCRPHPALQSHNCPFQIACRSTTNDQTSI